MFPSQNSPGGVFPMAVVAAASVALLVVAALWQITFGNTMSAGTPSSVEYATTTEDADVSLLDASSTPSLTPLGTTVLSKIALAYQELDSTGAYTPEAGEAAAKEIAITLRPSVTSHVYQVSDITTTPDASNARLRTYRSELQTALNPLLKNTSYELTLYAHYIATKDASALQELRRFALNYHQATLNASQVIVPASAATIHVRLLNALDSFGATLAAQVESATDPYASAALLSTYNSAESEVFLSFDALTEFFRAKIPL